MVSHPQKGMELELISMGGNTVDYIHMHKYSSACECVNKMSYIHRIEKYSFRKRSEVLIHAAGSIATACIAIECIVNIITSERSQLTQDHILYGSIYMKYLSL